MKEIKDLIEQIKKDLMEFYEIDFKERQEEVDKIISEFLMKSNNFFKEIINTKILNF